MKLINAVNAHIAASDMYGFQWPYGLALALAKVKRRTEDETLFFVEREKELAMEYAETGGDGRMLITPDGTFSFREPGMGAEYARRRRELCETEVCPEGWPLRAAAPAEMRPEWIDALEGFIEFTEPPDEAAGAKGVSQ